MDFGVDYTVTDDDIVTVVITGPMDVATVPRLRDPLIHLIDKGHYRLMLDMSAVDFIDSIGLGVILGVVHRLRPHDGSLAVAAPSAQARKAFQITQLIRVLSVHETTDAAITSIRAGNAMVSATRPITERRDAKPPTT